MGFGLTVKTNKKIIMLVLTFFVLLLTVRADNRSTKAPVLATDFEGNGTYAAPFLLETREDLCLLRDYVEQGEHFQDCFFC